MGKGVCMPPCTTSGQICVWQSASLLRATYKVYYIGTTAPVWLEQPVSRQGNLIVPARERLGCQKSKIVQPVLIPPQAENKIYNYKCYEYAMLLVILGTILSTSSSPAYAFLVDLLDGLQCKN